jgi:hypothetical protein
MKDVSHSTAVLGIRDILVRIRISGSVPLTNGSGSDYFLHWFKRCKSLFLSVFLITCPQAHHLQSKKFYILLTFSVKILFCRHYFSPLNTFMRKGKDPDPDPYLWIIDPDPGGPKTCGIPNSAVFLSRKHKPCFASLYFFTVSSSPPPPSSASYLRPNVTQPNLSFHLTLDGWDLSLCGVGCIVYIGPPGGTCCNLRPQQDNSL